MVIDNEDETKLHIQQEFNSTINCQSETTESRSMIANNKNKNDYYNEKVLNEILNPQQNQQKI